MRIWMVVVVILTVAMASGIANTIEERRGDKRIGAFVHRMPESCFLYRHIDRVDSAYFELGCRKPLPDSLVLKLWRAP